MSTPITQKTVDLGDGLTIHYVEGGEGKTVLYMHGAGGRSPEGAAYIPALASRYRVLLPSRPGYDESTTGKVETLQDVANAMAAFVRKTGNGPVNVVAQSGGAAPALWLTILHPDLVDKLILSAPAAFAGRVRNHTNGFAAATTEAERMAVLYGTTPAWTSEPPAAEHERVAKNSIANRGRFASPAGPANDDLFERLPEIQCFTLLLEGGADKMIPPEALEPYQQRIPHCYRMIIYGAAHELPISATDRWVELVSDFIDRGEAFLVNPGHQVPF